MVCVAGTAPISANAFALAAQGESLAIFFNCDLLGRSEILFYVRSFQTMACEIQAAFKFFSENKSQETEKGMTGNVFIPHCAPSGVFR